MLAPTKRNENPVNLEMVWQNEEPLVVRELAPNEEAEVLEFLRERAEHTFGMAGFIGSNGLVSPHNRGVFFGCRNPRGELKAVALIGHFILFEARTEASIRAIAGIARNYTNAKMLLGDQEQVELFWQYYSEGGQPARLQCRERLYAIQEAPAVDEPVTGLRLARMDDLDIIVPAHAESAFLDSGENPLEKDADGFRARCARRIEQGQTWVWVEEDVLRFKAEIITDTEEVIYLEGVWVDQRERGKGYGRRCLSDLTRRLLERSRNVCLLVNEQFEGAQAFYEKTGYTYSGSFDTIFLKHMTN
jgi:predicted GNAT family acetyltransferase